MEQTYTYIVLVKDFPGAEQLVFDDKQVSMTRPHLLHTIYEVRVGILTKEKMELI